MSADDRIDKAGLLYERAVFGGDRGALDAADRELDAVEADLALARGRNLHGRFLAEHAEDPDELPLFERAAHLYGALGDRRGEADALFWLGTCHQLVRGDDAAAVPLLERSAELAREVDDRLTLSYALRHLGIADHAAGRLDGARQRLEDSTRLRRELAFLPGVAANLIGLAYVAAAQERRADAAALIAEAAEVARECDAAGLLSSIEEARSSLTADPGPGQGGVG